MSVACLKIQGGYGPPLLTSMGDKHKFGGQKYTKYNKINNNLENFRDARLLLRGLCPFFEHKFEHKYFRALCRSARNQTLEHVGKHIGKLSEHVGKHIGKLQSSTPSTVLSAIVQR